MEVKRMGLGLGVGGNALQSPALRIRGLTKDHAGEQALKGVSLTVPAGTLSGIIGADGAGKSTLLSIVSTLMDPDAGEATVLGRDLRRDFRAIRPHIAFMPQRFSLYPDLSVLENLDFFADLHDLKRDEKEARRAQLLAFSGLGPFGDRRAGRLSGGMKQKLALSCCLLHRPQLLLLDEPTVGVDPVARRDFWTMLKALRDEGLTIVVSTPYMDEAALCDTLLLLHEGRELASGTPRALRAGYPHALYRVTGPKPLTFSAREAPPEGAAQVYPSGGALHVAWAAPQPPPPNWWTFFPGADAAVLHEPQVEDVFFSLLHESEAKNTENVKENRTEERHARKPAP
jgi:ABC-2 type transport system ATP-binding protein